MTPESLQVYRFTAEGLDPITVYVERYGAGRSRIVVRCFARAWTAFWGSHGSGTVEQFFCGCNDDYLADNLTWGFEDRMLKLYKKHDREYLTRIIKAIRSHWSAA